MYGASKYDIANGRIEGLRDGQNSSSQFVVVVWTGWMEWDD